MPENNPELDAEILRQVLRFKSHPNFPVDTTELEKAFRDVCPKPEIAQKVGTEMIQKLYFAPVPANVYEAHQALNERNELPTANQTEDDHGPQIGDTPFSGHLSEFLDEEIIERLRRQITDGKFHIQRETARQLVAAWDNTHRVGVSK